MTDWKLLAEQILHKGIGIMEKYELIEIKDLDILLDILDKHGYCSVVMRERYGREKKELRAKYE